MAELSRLSALLADRWVDEPPLDASGRCASTSRARHRGSGSTRRVRGICTWREKRRSGEACSSAVCGRSSALGHCFRLRSPADHSRFAEQGIDDGVTVVVDKKWPVLLENCRAVGSRCRAERAIR